MSLQRLLLLAAAPAILAAPLTAQLTLPDADRAVQLNGGYVGYGNDISFATDRDFTAEGWLRATPLATGPFDLFSRIDPPNEHKYLRVHLDGTVSGMYYGPLTSEFSTAPGAFPFDLDWHHLALVVEDAGGMASLYVDGFLVGSAALGGGFTGFSVNSVNVLGLLGASGWQVSELRVSSVARYSAEFTPQDPVLDTRWQSDPDTLLLVTGQVPEPFTGAPPGLADWSPNQLQPTAFGAVVGGVPGMHRDVDGDGILDDDELAAGTSPFDRDSDDDGLSDFEEWIGLPAVTGTDPLILDTDEDGVQDGTELGMTVPIPGKPLWGVSGTDPLVFIPDADPSSLTDPLDQDSDDDGFCEGDEDLNSNGWAEAGELDAAKVDTDDDWIQDGTESGLLVIHVCPDTDLAVFVEDADPATVTDPLNPDTDFGSSWDGPLHDGREDLNQNGAFEAGETDPLDNWDDHFLTTIPGLSPGMPFYVIVQEARPGSLIDLYIGLSGYGRTPSLNDPSFDLGILAPYEPGFPMLGIIQVDANGNGVYSGTLSPTVPTGVHVYFQAMELTPTSAIRLSYPGDRTIL